MPHLDGTDINRLQKRLPRDFFTRDGITVARELLGKILVHETAVGTVRGIITEVESYMGGDGQGGARLRRKAHGKDRAHVP